MYMNCNPVVEKHTFLAPLSFEGPGAVAFKLPLLLLAHPVVQARVWIALVWGKI